MGDWLRSDLEVRGYGREYGRDDEDNYGDPYEYGDYDYSQQYNQQRRQQRRTRNQQRYDFNPLETAQPAGLRRIGFTLVLAGGGLTLLGVFLFFERSLLRLGHLCLLVGLPLVVGPARLSALIFNRQKIRAVSCFLLGFLLVMKGWGLFGVLLEVFGVFNLFGNMFPLLLAMARRLPILGDLLPRARPDNWGDRGYEEPPRRRDDWGY